MKTLLLLSLLLAGCAAPVTQAQYVAPELQVVPLQTQLAAAEGAAAIRTAEYQQTASALSVKQTEAFLPIEATNAAALATAEWLPTGIAQTQIVASQSAAETEAARGEWMTAQAHAWQESAAVAEATQQAAAEANAATGRAIAGLGWGILQFVTAIALAALLVAGIVILWAFVMWQWRPREIGGRLYQPALTGWVGVPLLPVPEQPAKHGPTIENNFATEARWRMWFIDVLTEGIDTRRVEGGSVAYQRLKRVISYEAWDQIFVPGLEALQWVKRQGQGKAPDICLGWTVGTIIHKISNGATPPHPQGEPPKLLFDPQQPTVKTAVNTEQTVGGTV